MSSFRARRYIALATFGFGLMGAATVSLVVSPPAAAQFTVFDPSNYSQNVLTAGAGRRARRLWGRPADSA